MNSILYLSITLGSITLIGIIAFIISFRVYKRMYNPDISVSEMKESETRISDFLSKSGIDEDYTLDDIIKALNILIEEDDNDLEPLAYIYEENNQKKIKIKSGHAEDERKFDIAHECAHVINGDSIPACRPEGSNKSEIDQIADYTAAALLMPIKKFYNDLIEYNYNSQNIQRRKKIVLILCKKYQVNYTIVLRRIKEVYMIKGNID